MSNSSVQFSPSSVQKELSIRSEPIQRIYNFYINNIFYVNRRYQRKLVWTIEEKRAFIDSILQGFPVPIILLAQTDKEGKSVFEIIDGMQRLNAITSFIEGEFEIDGKFFDLATMVESKSCFDQGIVNQKTPILERSVCEVIASYVMPLSVYSFNDEDKIDEVFRRINSNGKYLSRQELRTSGATAYFPELVRKISSEIRTDISASDILLLNDMKLISITNKDLEYGIKIDDIFWVVNNVLTKEKFRESNDEEIVADLVAYMALPEVTGSSSERLDEFYGVKGSSKQEEIEIALQKINPEKIRERFLKVYDQIRQILDESKCRFSELIFPRPLQSMPRYFQIVFLSIHDLMFKENMEVKSYKILVSKLKNIGQHITITTGGNWSAKNKNTNISAVIGIIKDAFKKKKQADPATDSWLTEFETLLTQSKTEQTLFDFKQGFTRLDGKGEFDEASFSKIIKTLTAMANHSCSAVGYICVGVADNEADAKRIENLYSIKNVEYNKFKITGIGHEATRLKGNLDNFFKWLIQKVKSQPIEQAVKDNIGTNIKIVNYYSKDVVVFSIKGGKAPVMYDNRYYQRIGANVEEVEPAGYLEFFLKFS
ncbi:divergent AAA domain-containing protein [Rivularia sp. PCC 7116]|uniref:GmrSD restriction endonuclease domain-containing protein n=1 Tax=Rivularia sp. PCC 7116 TaxID=373994 RepID=UPI00029F3453|nr:DUF262 domain-containing protein [Rivularia sp. PCC 7116]AFY53721.1 divergent AAA domain-containing protein [Rivularia sp. PCC 7116]